MPAIPSAISMPVVVALCNFFAVQRSDAWSTPYRFSVHAGYVAMDRAQKLADNSTATHLDCSSTIFAADDDIKKCKMMRSLPMFLNNASQVWPVLGEQMTYALTKHILMIFLAFTSFWGSQYAITEFAETQGKQAMIRIIVVVVVAILLILDLFLDSTEKGRAQGSFSTAIAFIVVFLLIMLSEYIGTKAQPFVLYHQKKEGTELRQVEAGAREPHDVEIMQPINKHMHRNIYLSYACLLMLPLVVLLILSNTHKGVVDVHIQLVFFSFLFYATLDVFQTRTTAVLLCLKQAAIEKLVADGLSKKLAFVKFFVVLAFLLCKCFVLVPAMVLLQKQYNSTAFLQTTVAMHYVLLIGFALADLVQITLKTVSSMPMDLMKLLVMLVYTGYIFFAHLVVDKK